LNKRGGFACVGLAKERLVVQNDPPPWLTVATAPAHDEQAPQRLDPGVRDAIALALALQANLMLMDDRAGVAVARAQGLAVVGTIGILDLAGRRKLIDIGDAVARLKTTNFRYRPGLLRAANRARQQRWSVSEGPLSWRVSAPGGY
jgi:predicted nucleic acid-binding protein